MNVLLIDENDRPVGEAEKMRAHREGLLHRAFSVFIFNSAGELLIQRRAMEKYHSPGLWANTCCSHPMPGEEVEDSARRRLVHEMGLTADIRFRLSFIYRGDVGGELTEHEYDHLFTGCSDAAPSPNTDEVMDYRYVGLERLRQDIALDPDSYCVWFRIIFSKYYNQLVGWTG